MQFSGHAFMPARSRAEFVGSGVDGRWRSKTRFNARMKAPMAGFGLLDALDPPDRIGEIDPTRLTVPVVAKTSTGEKFLDSATATLTSGTFELTSVDGLRCWEYLRLMASINDAVRNFKAPDGRWRCGYQPDQDFWCWGASEQKFRITRMLKSRNFYFRVKRHSYAAIQSCNASGDPDSFRKGDGMHSYLIKKDEEAENVVGKNKTPWGPVSCQKIVGSASFDYFYPIL